MMYEVQSKSNATKEIKQKLFLVQKNVFPQNFSPVYCRSGCTFRWAPTTAGSRRRPGLRSWNPWPPPRSSSSPPGSAWWHTADSFLWVTGNTLPRIYQAKIRHFWDPGSRRRPTKCTQRRRRAHQIWSLIVNFFTMHRTSSRMLKFVLTEPVGHVQDLSQWPGILLNSLTASVATRSWIVLIFFEIGGGPVHQCFWWP